MSTRSEDKAIDIPEELYDASTKTRYKRHRYFGKGGFAKCYEIIDTSTNKSYAGKIVSKKLMHKQGQKDKMTQEITIHKSLNHKNIVQFHSFFDDPNNVYIVLELCKKRSMMELHKRRRVIFDYECRFYIYQIIQGVKYLHDNRIIHRDIKLGNLFLNDDLTVKIGDFGLATRIEFDGERKKTLCGTPNYIAPEILNKKGHSYEVDIWSIGCVMYTLLVGLPPFETKSLKDTYLKIKKCDYRIPNDVRQSAADMIVAMLQAHPDKRPKVGQLLNYDFLAANTIPTSLPISCLTMAPRPELLEYNASAGNRKPLSQVNGLRIAGDGHREVNQIITNPKLGNDPYSATEGYRRDIEILKAELASILTSSIRQITEKDLLDENTDPDSQPLFWISKWVDYSDKYGFGYQLCDEGVGVLFNDATKLIVLGNGINVHFIDQNGRETYMTMNEFPSEIDKKIKLLTYFKRYMSEHLVKTGASNVSEFDSVSRIPHLHAWFRTSCAVIMYLTNGTVQLNFSDHVKLILCPLMKAVSIIEADKNFRTYKFSTIMEHGTSHDLSAKLRYALDKLEKENFIGRKPNQHEKHSKSRSQYH